MPDEPQVPDAPEEVTDPGFDPELDSPSQVIEQPEAAPPPPADSRPRAADGTFLPKPHDPHLVEMALDLGVPQQEIDSTPPAELSRLIKYLHKQSVRSQQLRADDVNRPERASPEPVVDDDAPLGLEGEDEIAPQILKGMKAQRKELRELRQHIQAGERQRQDESNIAYADRMFADHGDPAKVGAGNVSTLKADSKEQRYRQTVVNHAALMAGRNATASQVIAKIPEALQELNGAKAPAPTVDPVEAELQARREAWRGGGLHTPTHKKPREEPFGPRRAAKAVAALQRENGAVEETEEDSLPE